METIVLLDSTDDDSISSANCHIKKITASSYGPYILTASQSSVTRIENQTKPNSNESGIVIINRIFQKGEHITERRYKASTTTKKVDKLKEGLEINLLSSGSSDDDSDESSDFQFYLEKVNDEKRPVAYVDSKRMISIHSSHQDSFDASDSENFCDERNDRALGSSSKHCLTRMNTKMQLNAGTTKSDFVSLLSSGEDDDSGKCKLESEFSSSSIHLKKLKCFHSIEADSGSDDSLFLFPPPFPARKERSVNHLFIQKAYDGAYDVSQCRASTEINIDVLKRASPSIETNIHTGELTDTSTIQSKKCSSDTILNRGGEPSRPQLTSRSDNRRSSAGSSIVPTPALPVIDQICGKLYPDLRNQCIKALISHAKLMRRAIYQRGALDASIRAIVSFALYPYPVRTPEAAARLEGVGSELLTVFKDMMKATADKNKPYEPPRGKFSSVAAATLVALAEFEVEREDTICSLEELVERINCLCHNPTSATHVLDKNVSYYLNKENIDPGWLQIRKLCTGMVALGLEPMLKERRKKELCSSGIGFQLTDRGRKQAETLKQQLERGSLPPGPLRQLASATVDDNFGVVTMCMDFREGGGCSKSLHKMCDLLDDYQVPYVVRDLKISDYVFFVGNKLAPILIERKSVDDVANSLNDGRWERQQRNMRKAQYVLGNGHQRKCKISYLIEGDASRRVVHGGVVGRTSWDISVETVENAIASLPALGFSVMRSKSHMGTMNILSQVARDVCWKYKNGSLDCLYTYEEFLREMKRCPDSLGNPPTEPEFQNPIPPVVDSVSATTRHDDGANNSNNEIMILGNDEHILVSTQQTEQRAELEKLTIAQLKEMCKDRDEKISGSKNDLVQRLLSERKPEVLLTRARRHQYVPKLPSCNAALLIALFLNTTSGTEGLSKERLMLLAEETGVSKDPIGGKGGWYDGWAGMKDMTIGDPALVSVKKRKYSLTTQPSGSAGVDVAKALHVLAHKQNLCRCGAFRL